MGKHGCRLRPMVRARGAAAALTAAITGLALVPASGGAALTTFGSDLAAAANVSSARPVDTAYWQVSFADGRSVVAPASGQLRSVRIKGIALSSPVAGVPGGETDFHVQVAQPLPGGTFGSVTPAARAASSSCRRPAPIRRPSRRTSPRTCACARATS